MLRTTLRTASAIALLTIGASLVLALDRPVREERGTNAAVRAKSLLGTQVRLEKGTRIGTIEDIVFSDEGVVEYLILSDNGKMVTVPWEAAKFNHEKRMATINLAPEQFQQIPTYTQERYPNFYAPTYRNEIYKHYGLTPGQDRRLERRERREDRKP